MPTQTFFNLSKEKQERIISGAIQEFSEKTLAEASIANIVKNADIARGSFYQYFEDKEDLYFYLIGLFRHNYHQSIIQCLEKNDGDFFIAFKNFGNKYISDILGTNKVGLFENIYLYMSVHINRAHGYHPKPLTKSNLPEGYSGKDFTDYVNFTNLLIDTDEELLDVFKFVIGMLNDTIMEGKWRSLSVLETQKNFQKKLRWIFYGILKDKDREGER